MGFVYTILLGIVVGIIIYLDVRRAAREQYYDYLYYKYHKEEKEPKKKKKKKKKKS